MACVKNIYKVRKEFIEKFTPVFNQYYQFISEGNETVELIYQSHLNDGDFGKLTYESRQKDLLCNIQQLVYIKMT